jgi:hypothetical protein
MSLVIPTPFVPSASSDAVQKLRRTLGTDRTPVLVPVVTEAGLRERDCYLNVRNRVDCDGGRMQLGWAVWQHAHLFIEAEPHAVYEPSEGKTWVDCTPHTFPDGTQWHEILFIEDNDATYNFDAPVLRDNVRVPLVNDPRVLEALRLFSQSRP